MLMIRSLVLRALSLVMLALPGISWSNEPVQNMLSTYRLTVGVSLNSIDFDVGSEGNTDPYGTLSEDFSYSPYIILGSPYKYAGESDFGGLMEYSFSGFNLSRQEVGGELVDLGTSVTGYYVFITPTVFYSFFGQDTNNKYDQTLVMGMGLGLGYLKAEGDIIFTATTRERHNIDISGPALAVSGFIDYRAGNFTTRISAVLNNYTKDSLDYDAFGFTWDFGYIFGL